MREILSVSELTGFSQFAILNSHKFQFYIQTVFYTNSITTWKYIHRAFCNLL